MEDWLKCQINPIVKYRQNQNQIEQLVIYDQFDHSSNISV